MSWVEDLWYITYITSLNPLLCGLVWNECLLTKSWRLYKGLDFVVSLDRIDIVSARTRACIACFHVFSLRVNV